MKKLIKKSFVFIISILIVLGSFSINVLAAENAKVGSVEIGTLVKFGEYNNSPIVWRVIGKDASGNALLFSEYIISYKAFDDQLWLANTDMNYGNNYWATSDIRTWLNTADDVIAGMPTKGLVKDGYNAYDSEPGFLKGFKSAEVAAIVEGERNQLVDSVNASLATGGTVFHKYEQDLDKIISNYDNAKNLKLNEKVFLLDVKEIHDFVYKAGFSLQKDATPEAIQKAEQPKAGKISQYWLRSPRATSDPDGITSTLKNDGASVRMVYGNELVLSADAYDGSVGIAPAVVVNKNFNVEIVPASEDKEPTTTTTTTKETEATEDNGSKTPTDATQSVTVTTKDANSKGDNVSTGQNVAKVVLFLGIACIVASVIIVSYRRKKLN